MRARTIRGRGAGVDTLEGSSPKPKHRSAVRGAGETNVRTGDSGGPTLSSLDALKIIRHGLDETRPATAFDWHKVEQLFGNADQSPPPDAITRQDWAMKFGKSQTGSKSQLDKLTKSGVLETGMFFDKAKTNWVRYWWFAKEKP